ncbi:MAG: T9SS type A sorting domain-containing protein, partial [Bacteroidia bacterium]
IPMTTTSFALSSNIPGNSSIPVNFVRAYDITPNCGGATAIACGTPANTAMGPSGSRSAIVYESAPIQISAAPPVGGYLIQSTGLPCCRQMANNLSCQDMTLRSKMFAFTDASGQVVAPSALKDVSPTFYGHSQYLLNLSQMDTTSLSFASTDADFDSLSYAFDVPWSTANTPCTYINGFTIQNPMAGIIASNGNGIDPVSGMIAIRASVLGAHILCVRVDAFRDGQKIAEVYRDVHLTVVNGGILGSSNRSPKINVTAGNVSVYNGTIIPIFEGDTLKLSGMANDWILGTVGDTVVFGVNSPVLAQATVNGTNTPNPVWITERNDSVGLGEVNHRTASVQLSWVASAGGASSPKMIPFIFTARDRVCPNYAQNRTVIWVQVVPQPTAQPARLKPIQRVSNGYKISWDVLVDTSSKFRPDPTIDASILRRWNSFQGLLIYRKVNNGQDSLIHSLVKPTNITTASQVRSWVAQNTEFIDTDVRTEAIYQYTTKALYGSRPDTTTSGNNVVYNSLSAGNMGGQLISIYPNPAHDMLFVSGLKTNTSLSILNVEGKTMLRQNWNEGEGISIKGLSNGIYFLNWKDGNQIRSMKFIVE